MSAIIRAVLSEGLTDCEWAALETACEGLNIPMDETAMEPGSEFQEAKAWFQIGLSLRGSASDD